MSAFSFLGRIATAKSKVRKSDMKKQTLWISGPFVAAVVLLAGTGSFAAQQWVEVPKDQGAFENDNATFTAAPKVGDLTFQWMRQWRDKVELLKGETGSSLTLSNVGIGDVGHYLCAVTQKDQVQLTPAASLTVGVKSASPRAGKISSGAQSFSLLDYEGETLTLFGSPVFSSGSQGGCPGSYVGYVNYTKPVSQGWGWAPAANTTVHTASDNNRTDTKVQYVGKSGDIGCDQTSVTVPHPAYSSKYRFTIYFPDNVPTDVYPITLTGFNP
jgi:hypothetical protein